MQMEGRTSNVPFAVSWQHTDWFESHDTLYKMGWHFFICQFAPYLTCKNYTLYRMHHAQFLHFGNHFFSYAVLSLPEPSPFVESVPVQNALVRVHFVETLFLTLDNCTSL